MAITKERDVLMKIAEFGVTDSMGAVVSYRVQKGIILLDFSIFIW